jgi:hypothetical protein
MSARRKARAHHCRSRRVPLRQRMLARRSGWAMDPTVLHCSSRRVHEIDANVRASLPLERGV